MKRTHYSFAIAMALAFSSGVVLAQNYKIKQSTSISGQNITSTVYVKGSRKRTESSGMMGMGGDVADIEQCDLKRTVKVSDKKKIYFVEPFATEQSETAPAPRPAVTTTTGNVTKGGTITMTSVITDTGERKQMFGLTARHIKTTMTMQSSPDTCSKCDMRIDTDGWYVDLPQFSCPMRTPRNPMAGMREPTRGCMDRTIVKSSGSGKLGFPLQLTQTINTGGGEDAGFSQTIETLEFTKTTLDNALFDVPASYAIASRISVTAYLQSCRLSKRLRGSGPFVSGGTMGVSSMSRQRTRRRSKRRRRIGWH